MSKYNYVFFDEGAIKNGKKDKDNYYYLSTIELRQLDNVKVVNYPMDELPIIFHWIDMIAARFKNQVTAKIKKMLYPLYFKNSFREKRELCFIVYGYYIQPDYVTYLKKKYPSCKLVKIHRDLIELWHERNPMFTREKVKQLFDLELTYDKLESQKYQIGFFDEILSKVEIPVSEQYPLCDVFFAGAAKDRLPKLIAYYDYLTSNNIQCQFYITGVSEQNKILRPGIEYAERPMSYRQMLYRSVNARCILEINQAGAVGYTSRFLEAVIYNKRLITNNLFVRESSYYRPDYIQCVESETQINLELILQDTPINYEYKNDFSPVKLIKIIESELDGSEK